MLKKIWALFLVAIVFVGLTLSLKTPVFSNYAKEYEVYLHSASSLAQRVKADKIKLAFIWNAEGESVTLDREQFNLERLFKDFNAHLKFVERAEDVEIYYAYSPKIKYGKTVKGEKINLHIAIAKDRVTLGSPLIFGSF